jgi:hypothetical protein
MKCHFDLCRSIVCRLLNPLLQCSIKSTVSFLHSKDLDLDVRLIIGVTKIHEGMTCLALTKISIPSETMKFYALTTEFLRAIPSLKLECTKPSPPLRVYDNT